MSLSDIIIIILSLISLLASLTTTIFAVIVSKEAQKKKNEMRRIEAVIKAREISRLEVEYAEIADQMESLSEQENEQIIQVKAKRRFPNSSTGTQIAGLWN